MSFIRCTSNPEGLYIYHGPNGQIYIHGGEKSITIIPANIFYKFIKSITYCGQNYKKGSLEIKEEYFSFRKKKTDIENIFNLPPAGNFKYVLYYKNEKVAVMWRVTWCYIYNNIKQSLDRKKIA